MIRVTLFKNVAINDKIDISVESRNLITTSDVLYQY